MNQTPASPRPPLGIPAGSVRAILALAVFGTSMAHLVLGLPVEPTLWLVTIVVLLYYFASRAHAVPDMETAGQARPTPPLGLPRGTVRWLLFLGFAGTAGYLGWRWYTEGIHPIDDTAFFPLLALTSFFVGVAFRRLFRGPGFRVVHDAKALVALACAASVVLIHLLHVDFPGVEHVKRATLSFIIFYFSSR